MIVVCTGHRPDKITPDGWRTFGLVWPELVAFARHWLRYQQTDHLITGCAQGWDQACMAAAIAEGITFTAAIPFAGFDEKWSPISRQHLREMLVQSAHTEVVSDPGYAAFKLHRRNEWMVNHLSEICWQNDEPDEKANTKILALYNGSQGGTRNCLDYAHSRKVPILNVWDAWTTQQGYTLPPMPHQSDRRPVHIATNIIKRKEEKS